MSKKQPTSRRQHPLPASSLVRKLRVIYNDPDATDSSSEDEYEPEPESEPTVKPKKIKRCITEISLPLIDPTIFASVESSSFAEKRTNKSNCFELHNKFPASVKISTTSDDSISILPQPSPSPMLDVDSLASNLTKNNQNSSCGGQ